jgi:hypothetical protein
MRSLIHSTIYLLFFCSIIFFGVKCQKDNELSITNPIEKIPERKGQTELTARALGDTLFIPIAYGGELKVYPNTIVRCRNKKTGKFEYQAVFSGDQLLPACKHQQINYYDKVNVSDTALIRPNDTFYLCRRVIK